MSHLSNTCYQHHHHFTFVSGVSSHIPSDASSLKRIVKDMLPPSQKILACGCGNYLFAEGGVTTCPTCGSAKSDPKGHHSYFYVNIIPRIRMMYEIPALAKLLRTTFFTPSPDVVNDIAQTTFWQNDFGQKCGGNTHSLGFCFSGDGFNPNRHLSSQSYSLWVQVLMIFNLPPAFRNMLNYMLLVGVIPGEYHHIISWLFVANMALRERILLRFQICVKSSRCYANI